MKNFVLLTRITAVLTCLSLAATLIIHYMLNGDEAEFWCNVCLAVFGSGLLTFITSCIGYVSEKIRTLEGFSYSTRSLLHILQKYDLDWDLERKVDFFLDYSDKDTSIWDAQLGAIYFMFDRGKKKFNYIYQKIYKPILDLNRMVANHEIHFELYKKGIGRNEAVMARFVAETEELFMEKLTRTYTLEDGKAVRGTSVQNRLVHSTLKELNGRYYDIMYGKKQAESEEV